MAILIPLLNSFGFHICILLAILVFSYLWVQKQWKINESKNLEENEIDQEIAEENSEFEEDSEEEIAPALPDDLEHVPLEFKALKDEEMIEKSLQFYQVLNTRRTVRFYSDKKIPKEVIDNIVATAGTAPSGAHTEPWTYVVVSGLHTYLFTEC